MEIGERRENSMKALGNYLGLALVLAGAILLMVAYWVGWTSSNLVLSGGLLLVVLGAILHIRAQKKGEKY